MGSLCASLENWHFVMAEESLRDTPQQRARKAFEALIAGDDDAIDLAQAALLIACEEYTDLNVAHYMDKLDSLAQEVRDIFGLSTTETSTRLPPERILEAMNYILFELKHFQGNSADYYNPCNSFLNDVLDRHTGIPITLSLLYMEVGKRLGLQIDGVGLPWHFIVRCRLASDIVYIDPFAGGRFLTEHDCYELVQHHLKAKVKFNPQWLEPVSKKQLLLRLLGNLKHIYIFQVDYERALSVCDRILLLAPDSPTERRDRGAIHLQLKHYSRALRDLKAYIVLAPHANDISRIQQQIREIRQMIALLN
jgi:regulator of sirC expression with transglutaminase-like and TPR domain